MSRPGPARPPGTDRPLHLPPHLPPHLLSLDELCARVGMSVRNVRFYTTRGLIPSPIRRGRSGYYTPDHVARLELVQELQSHGFTLSAIERYVAAIPAGATPEDIALARTTLAPWDVERPIEMTRTELSARAGRELSEDDLRILASLGVIFPLSQGTRTAEHRTVEHWQVEYWQVEYWQVAVSQLSVGLGLIELGFPVEAAQAAADIFARHGREMSQELYDNFRTLVWPVYKEQGYTPETVRQVVEKIKPLSIASLVSAYETAMDETGREQIARRSGTGRATT